MFKSIVLLASKSHVILIWLLFSIYNRYIYWFSYNW